MHTQWIPFTYNIGTAGSNDGAVSFSTWRTGTTATTKTALGTTGVPAGVTNMNDNGVEMPRMQLTGSGGLNFRVMPRLPQPLLHLLIADAADFTGTNITGGGGSETNLQAQYWNGSQWVRPGMGTDVPANNVVTTGITSQTVNAPWALALSTSPLPIELLSFNAICSGNKVILNWATVSETNNDFFTIERSTDANDFTLIGTVNGAGNSNTTLYYQFIYQPETGNFEPSTVYYYRLKQTDYNGNYTYSGIDAVSCSDSPFEYINVYPNPASDQLNCNISSKENTVANISITDVPGQRVILEKVNISKGENHLLINISALAPAPYYFKIETSNGLYKDCKQILVK